MSYEASWAVRYKDGTLLTQYDATHADALNGEVPFKKINWHAVTHVIFESQYDKMEMPLPKAAPGKTWSLRARVTMALAGKRIRIFALMHHVAGVPVDEHSVDKVIYWTPTGVLHTCRWFDCSAIRTYGQRLAHGQSAGLMPLHDKTETTVDAVLHK